MLLSSSCPFPGLNKAISHGSMTRNFSADNAPNCDSSGNLCRSIFASDPLGVEKRLDPTIYFKEKATSSTSTPQHSFHQPQCIQYQLVHLVEKSAPRLIELVLCRFVADERLQREGLTISETAMRRRSASKREWGSCIRSSSGHGEEWANPVVGGMLSNLES